MSNSDKKLQRARFNRENSFLGRKKEEKRRAQKSQERKEKWDSRIASMRKKLGEALSFRNLFSHSKYGKYGVTMLVLSALAYGAAPKILPPNMNAYDDTNPSHLSLRDNNEIITNGEDREIYIIDFNNITAGHRRQVIKTFDNHTPNPPTRFRLNNNQAKSLTNLSTGDTKSFTEDATHLSDSEAKNDTNTPPSPQLPDGNDGPWLKPRLYRREIEEWSREYRLD